MQKEPLIKCFVTVFSSVAMQREMHRPIYVFIINFSCELLLAGEVQRACALTLNFLFRDCSHGGSKILQGGARVSHITAANKKVLS